MQIALATNCTSVEYQTVNSVAGTKPSSIILDEFDDMQYVYYIISSLMSLKIHDVFGKI